MSFLLDRKKSESVLADLSFASKMGSIEHIFCGCGNGNLARDGSSIRPQDVESPSQKLEHCFFADDAAWTESHPWMAALAETQSPSRRKRRNTVPLDATTTPETLDDDEWAELPKMVEQAARRQPKDVSTSLATRLAVLTRVQDEARSIASRELPAEDHHRSMRHQGRHSASDLRAGEL